MATQLSGPVMPIKTVSDPGFLIYWLFPQTFQVNQEVFPAFKWSFQTFAFGVFVGKVGLCVLGVLSPPPSIGMGWGVQEDLTQMLET